jgi:hypothetical protein
MTEFGILHITATHRGGSSNSFLDIGIRYS